jgi:peptide chain release factor 2
VNDCRKSVIIFDPPRIEGTINRLEKEMSVPEFWEAPKHARQVTTQLEENRSRLSYYRSLSEELDDIVTLYQLAMEADDEKELESIDAHADELSRKMAAFRTQLYLSGPHDTADCYLSINAGAGGTDSQDWAELLLRMYTYWCERSGFKTSLLEVTPADVAGIRSATVQIKGRYAYGYLKGESGVHRLVRISPFDSAHRRHTSFAAVNVIPVTEEKRIKIDPKDLRIDTYRSTGAGGQHVNVTDSAVRITHIPTGIVVSCQNERSQHQNKETAMRVLHSRLAELLRVQEAKKIEELKGTLKDIEWGSQIRSYVFHPYQLVKDHRTGVETGNVEAVMNGELDDFLEGWLEKMD